MKMKWCLPAVLGVAVAMPTAVYSAEDEEGGNNLSVPVILAENIAFFTVPVTTDFADTGCVEVDGTGLPDVPAGIDMNNLPPCVYTVDALGVPDMIYWLQQSANRWQADVVDGSAEEQVVGLVDWGDLLEVVPWFLNSKIRVELGLFKDDGVARNGYGMTHLWARGDNEMHGAHGSTAGGTIYEPSMIPLAETRVYSDHVGLTIQQMAEADAECQETLGTIVAGWDPLLVRWVGDDAGPVVVDEPVAGAEINVKGAVTYGYNWDANVTVTDTGVYRLTFYLKGGSNASFVEGQTEIKPITEEEAEALLAEYVLTDLRVASLLADDDGDGGSESGKRKFGGIPDLDFANNLTYLDMCLLDPATKGGGGGGGQGGPGGNGGGGPPDGGGGQRR